MKESDQTKDLTWDFDQSWGSFLQSNTRLCLNTFDFSDLWDEESSTEDEGTNATNEPSKVLKDPPAPPPLPPLPPPLPSISPKGETIKCRTLKLHWKELQNLAPLPRMTRFGMQTIWAGLEPVHLDTNRLEYLFESKGSSTSFNVVSGRQKQSPLSVLGLKRSNIITIALSRLPPPRLLPPAIYSMDSCVLDRDDIQRLQELIPTEEELSLIREASAQNPHMPLAQAEVCLLFLGEIPHLSTRFQLWAFALDYDSLERNDYSQVQSNFTQLEAQCKASWEQLKLLNKAEEKQKGRKGEKRRESDDALSLDGSLRHRLPKILKDYEERLKVLRAVHRRVMNRFHSFLLFLGYSRAMVRDTTPEDFCKNISNFSLEYRTMRQAILQQRERERQRSGAESPGPNTPVGRRKHQQTALQVSDEQSRLEEVLKTPVSMTRLDVTLPRNRRRMLDIQGPFSQKLKW
ncbi:FH1/FH2 domain-containing protein 3 isoform 3-T3 [Pholidichthys leucotaenia]